MNDPPTFISEKCSLNAFLVGFKQPAQPQIKTSPDSLNAADMFQAEIWIMLLRPSILTGVDWIYVEPVPT